MNEDARCEAEQRHLDRRAFLATGLAAGSLSALRAAANPVESGAGARAAEKNAIPLRSFGKTGEQMPILGFGGAGLPKVWFNPLSTEDRVKLVRHALDRGIRYIDTAPNYMESQSILGAALAGRRHEAFLVSKVESTRPDDVRKSVEGSLKELRTDYLDLVLIHGTPGLQQMSVSQAMKIHAELVKLRDAKVIRHVGLSAHGYFDKALALIASGGFDQCMLSYGYVPRGYDQVHSARMIALRDACLARAHELGMAIVAMKVVGAGLLSAWAPYVVPGFDKQRLQRLPAAAIRYVLQDPRIHVLTIGMRLEQEVDANIEILRGNATYTLDDRALLAEFSARLYETDAIKKLRIE
jgi:predicted aldo/keto reductase-like oxidoreductase